MTDPKPKRTTVSELAKTLAERRSAATAYVNIKVSAQGALQPDVNVTPDSTSEDVTRMTTLALEAVATIMAATPPKPEQTDAEKEAKQLGNAARIHAARARKAAS